MAKAEMLNLGSELQGERDGRVVNFKKLVSGEHLNAPRFTKRREMSTTAKLMFLSNHVPRFGGGTDADCVGCECSNLAGSLP